MSFLTHLANWIIKRSTLANPEQWMIDIFGGASTASGRNVTEDNALTNTGVYACVRVLAETIAALPLPIYQKLENGGKERASQHPLYEVLHSIPNTEMSSFTFRETLMGHLALRGNAYAEIEINRGGQVIGLWPLRPDKMEIKRANKRLLYIYTLPDGERVSLLQEQVLHIRGLGNNGIVGFSPIKLAKEAIGLGMATEEYGAKFFGSGAKPGGVLEHPGQLSENAQKGLRQSWNEMHQGLDKAHRIAVLEEGMSYKQIGMSPEDSQFLETREFQLNEIARIFRVPPHLIGDLKRATFGNIEHSSIDFVVHTIVPWLRRWEQEIYRTLFTPKERQEYFAEFLVEGLLRGDTASRYNAYSVGRQNGWLSADDIRELENMNPLPGGQGKIYLVPMNMVPADQLLLDMEPEIELRSHKNREASVSKKKALAIAVGRRRLTKSFQKLFIDTTAKILRREKADVLRAAKKMLDRRDMNSLNIWLEEFYQSEFPKYLERQFMPVFLTFADVIQVSAATEIGETPDMTPELEEFTSKYTATFVKRYTGSSSGQLKQIIDGVDVAGGADGDIYEAIETRFDGWEETRPGVTAKRETVQMAGAISLFVYAHHGFRRKRWVAIPPSCPYCKSLNDKTIDIKQPFLGAGEAYQPDEADRPLTTYTNIGHPGAHKGCDCVVIAESTW